MSSTVEQEVRVVAIDATGPVTKTGKQEWSFPVLITLADGRTIESHERHSKMRNAKADLAAHPKQPHNMTATEYVPGKWLFTMSMWIGPQGRKPVGY